MTAPRPDRAARGARWRPAGLAAIACGLAGVVGAAPAPTTSSLIDTRHNLSVSGPGPIRALTETRICIFCHTPHNATPLTPLWNKDVEPQVYTVYTSPTLRAGPLPQPSGPTKLCLSCHDGTIAMGAVINPAGGIGMAGADTLPPGSTSDFGLDLTGHHPVSFPYHASLPNAELSPTPPPDLTFGGADELHCITCHDPHRDPYGMFLVKDNRYSALCTTCHQMTGWPGSAHATSTAPVGGILPRPPKTQPAWAQLAEWGCEACHTPHFAPTAPQLLNFTSDPPSPFSCTSAGCHSSEPPPQHPATAGRAGISARAATPVRRSNTAGGMADIARQIGKISGHHELPGVGEVGIPGRTSRSLPRSAACTDCHNPHLAADRTASAPYATGLLAGVGGVDRNGASVRAVTYEYEVCFKCHADSATDLEYVPRVVGTTNTRLAFDPSNPSFHPVLESGRTLTVPSIPSSFLPTMTALDVIYCTTCHADDEGGSRGPHGSSYPPILKERYDTADGTPESYDSYALCYRCHERTSILADASFKPKAKGTTGTRGGHRGHLFSGATCATCHDPHGVPDAFVAGGGAGATGSHTHLINFDTRIVLPKPGATVPIFRDGGTFSGSCDLVCHGVLHDGASYP